MQQAVAPRSLFDEVMKLLDARDIEAALAKCESVLASYPEDINILGLLGAIQGDSGDFSAAERSLRRVMDLAPGFAKPYEDLGTLLLQQQRAEDAIPLLEKSLRLSPNTESAHFQLGKALAQLGRGEQADAAFEASFALSPVRKMMALAAEHHKAGRLEQAEKLCRQVLQKEPGQVDALRMLGLIAAAAGELEEAEHLLRQALKIAPDHIAAMFDLGKVLKEMDHLEEAVTVLQDLVARQPDNARAHFRLATVMGPAAMTEQSAAAYRRALALQPNHAGALLGLGHILKTLGQQDEGIAAYMRCIELHPDNGEVYYSLANLKTYQFSDTQLEDMKRRVAKEDVEGSAEVNFLFALGKAHEDRKDYDVAWQYYEQGNAKQRMLVNYDPVQTEVTNNALVKFFNSAFFARTAGSGNPNPAPIFILGMPRSGSTLVEQIIASHSQVEGTSELPYIGRLTLSLNRNRADGMKYPEVLAELEPRHYAQLGERYLQMARRHRTEGRPFFIDKMPNNFPCVGFIHALLPNAKIIDARRNPMDACVGNLKQLYAKGQTFSYDQTDIGEYYLQYQRMMDHWEDVLPGRVLRVQYEDTVADLETQVRRILNYLELPWEDSCLNYHRTARAVRTASSEQVRQPIYTSGVGAWKHFEQHLTELGEVLEPIMHRYQRESSR